MSNVTEHLEGQGVDFEVLPHEPTMTSLAEARALGLAASDVVKTVVLDVRTGHAFAVLPAGCRIDLDKVRAAIHSRHVTLSSEDGIARDYPEFELGAIPPLGALLRTPLIVDPQVVRHETVVFAAAKDLSVRMRTSDLFAAANIRVADICED